MAPPLCVAAPAHSVISLSRSTTFSLDPGPVLLIPDIVTVNTTAPMSASAPVSTVVPTAAASAAAANISRLVGTREHNDSLNFMVGYEYNMAEVKRL
ncbi:hypothetical protein M436DRAFT_81774 [Aureobasidium namibiae CBS 147.97]|uniref:Uncharacterized protein n=1 Tax=Aureobasidium namibiae CBS 147.97 TaxID=1043004 RepID=A0A074XFK5_9PEZI|nr:uncharacterized protein M436DRAFT_81774 [Aureobasidium namibiae CBS 147.97]KEQ73391.1 hypothetical protein M436DRAFT_81774 [Aureobasidium namibiae CBS 147.97]